MLKLRKGFSIPSREIQSAFLCISQAFGPSYFAPHPPIPSSSYTHASTVIALRMLRLGEFAIWTKSLEPLYRRALPNLPFTMVVPVAVPLLRYPLVSLAIEPLTSSICINSIVLSSVIYWRRAFNIAGLTLTSLLYALSIPVVLSAVMRK